MNKFGSASRRAAQGAWKALDIRCLSMEPELLIGRTPAASTVTVGLLQTLEVGCGA